MGIIKAGQCNKCDGNAICCNGCTHFKGGLCPIYEQRPHGCRLYPHNPMALEKGCTIYFIDDELGEITPENFRAFPEETKRAWLDMVIE